MKTLDEMEAIARRCETMQCGFVMPYKDALMMIDSLRKADAFESHLAPVEAACLGENSTLRLNDYRAARAKREGK